MPTSLLDMQPTKRYDQALEGNAPMNASDRLDQFWVRALAFVVLMFGVSATLAQAQNQFRIEEASIADIQRAVKSGQTSCRAVVQAYIDRAKAYNGTCTALVTIDG